MEALGWFLLLTVYVVLYLTAGAYIVAIATVVGLVLGLHALIAGALEGFRQPGRLVTAPNGDPAVVSFVTLQSWADIAALGHGGLDRLGRLRTQIYQAHATRIGNRRWLVGFVLPQGLGLAIGMVVALAIGMVVAAVVTVLAGVVFGVAALIAGGARLIDSTIARRRRVQIMCPSAQCTQEIAYPAYRCASCGQLHRDPRSWRVGVLSRECRCGASLHPLVAFGGSGQAAACPRCSAALDRSAGTVRDVVVPVIGASGAGKTSLIASMSATLVRSFGGRLGDPSAPRFQPLLDAAAARGALGPTPIEPADALQVIVRPEPNRSFDVQFHDLGGSELYDDESLDRLRCLYAADTYLVVVDVTSIPAVRRAIGFGDDLCAGAVESDVLAGIGLLLVRLSDVERRGRAAVVMTKVDVLREHSMGRALATAVELADVPAWLEEVEQGAFARAMQTTFEEVTWYAGSSWTPEGDTLSDPVLAPLGWLLGRDLVPSRRARWVHQATGSGGPSLGRVADPPPSSYPPPPPPPPSPSSPSDASLVCAANPLTIVVLVDQSGPTGDRLGPGGDDERICDVVARLVNELLHELVLRARGRAGIANLFDIAVIGHGSGTGPLWHGDLVGRDLVAVSDLAQGVRSVAGHTALGMSGEPRWVKGAAGGAYRHDLALQQALGLADRSRRLHPDARVPIIIDVTGSPEAEAAAVAASDRVQGVLHRHLAARVSSTEPGGPSRVGAVQILDQILESIVVG